MKSLLKASLILFLFGCVVPSEAAQSAEGARQPVFLICPHKKRFSAWSLSLIVDRNDPSKVLALNLEELTKKNSEDLAPNGYEKVLAAQRDESAPRKLLGELSASEFGSGQIRVEKDDALRVSLSKVDGESYRLEMIMRCTSDQRFNIGGKAQKTRDILFKYDSGSKTWGAAAAVLSDSEGNALASNGPLPLTGINFPVIGTGIYRIVGVLGDGNSAVVLVDGWRKH